MSLKKLALSLATAANMIKDWDVVQSPQPRIDPRTFGTNPKKCKTCVSFTWCKQSRNIRPKDVACASYKRVRSKGN